MKAISTIQKSVERFFEGERVSFDVMPTSELRYGDLTTNAAMAAYSTYKDSYSSPRALAEDISSFLEKEKSLQGIFSKIEVAGPGFINFWYSSEFLKSSLCEIVESEDILGVEKVEFSRRELVENTQPNTNKPLHIGHLRNTALGESIVSLRRLIGEDAKSVNLNNDRGIHIVKSMLGYLYGGLRESFRKIRGSMSDQEWEKKKIAYNLFGKYPLPWREMIKYWYEHKDWWLQPGDLEKREENKPDAFVGKFYIETSKVEDEQDSPYKQYLAEMLQAWEDGDEKVKALWEQMNGWFYEGFRQTHGRFLGIGEEGKQFDEEWYESQIYEEGKKIVMDNLGKGVFDRREDGAIMARLEKYNLPDKVVIRSDGTSIYITQDLALAKNRIEAGADFISYVVGSEQELHFSQLFAICNELEIGKEENFRHISYGMVNLAGGQKMSSRAGTVIAADTLMDEAKEKIKKEYGTEEDAKLEKIMLAAIKYWMLRYNPHQEIHFDIDESVNLSGNSGPYIQYTWARVQSVKEKADREVMTDLEKFKDVEFNQEEQEIMRYIQVFPVIVHQAAEAYSPNLICEFLLNLAQKYNTFYQKHRIVAESKIAVDDEGRKSTTIEVSTLHEKKDSENYDEQVVDFRLFLSEATARVLEQGLDLLGIETVEKM